MPEYLRKIKLAEFSDILLWDSPPDHVKKIPTSLPCLEVLLLRDNRVFPASCIQSSMSNKLGYVFAYGFVNAVQFIQYCGNASSVPCFFSQSSTIPMLLITYS